MKNQFHYNQVTGRQLYRGLRPTSRAGLAAAVSFERSATIPPFFWIFPKKMSMWLNDQYGDCVTAEEAFNKACNGIFILDSTVRTWASRNGVLNGADLSPVISLMRAAGFAQDENVYGDGAPQSINYTDAPTLQGAIFQAGMQGGCVKTGVAADQLPADAGNVNGWFLAACDPDENEDHCMGTCGYGTAAQFCSAMNAAFAVSLTVPSGIDPLTQGYAMYTWSTIGWVSAGAYANFVGEAWLRTPPSVNTGTGVPTPDQVWTSAPPAGGPYPCAGALCQVLSYLSMTLCPPGTSALCDSIAALLDQFCATSKATPPGPVPPVPGGPAVLNVQDMLPPGLYPIQAPWRKPRPR